MKTAAWMPLPNLLIPHCLYFGNWCVRADGHNSAHQLGDRLLVCHQWWSHRR